MNESAKRKILAENYARMVGIDPAKTLTLIADDEFDRQQSPTEDPLPPWSTTSAANCVE